MRKFVSLHSHTTGSIGDSTISPKELIAAIKEAGQTAVAVTDHGSLSAIWDTYKATKKTDVKLIAGCEAYFVEDSNDDEDTTLRHLILLAKNAIGYKNLLTMNKRGFDKFTVAFKRAVPRIDWELLEEFHEGIICTSACGCGVISQHIMADQLGEAKAAAKRLQAIFGDDFALELQPHNLQRRASPYSGAINQQKINMALKRIGQELGIRCIVTTDAHYLKKKDHAAHDVYICIASGQPKTSGSRLIYDKHEFYVKNSDQIFDHFSRHMPLWGEEFVESLFENTIYFSDKCENPDWVDPAVSTGEKSQLPDFPYKDEPDLKEFEAWKSNGKLINPNIGEDAQFYRYRSEIGLEKKIAAGKIPEADRDEGYASMREEFDVLEYRNFSSYMLITAEFLGWCRNNNIPVGPGRGSVGGSLTAYCNNIHMAYPKAYGLIFARFLNKYKEAFPDCDNDVAPSGREKLYNYLCDKYGTESVCHVSNINTITPKVYARDIARVFEFGGQGKRVAVEIGDNIADSLPAEMHSIKQALEEAPLFAEYAKQYPELIQYADLCGLPRAWSTHAGGIIISKRPLTGLVPLRRDPSGALVLEYDKEKAEENGLVKIDILGLETLDIIGETYRLIKETGKESPGQFDYEIDSKSSYDLIGEGNTFGVFQLGSTAVHVCKKVKPKSVADIALISALVRPAAKDTIPNLLKVRNGDEKMSLMHPSLFRAFASTYGFGLYEESLMYLAQDVAGWDLHDADKLRKLTKEKGKNPEKVKKWRQEFIEGAVKNKRISEEIATKVWDDVINLFQGYGFNRSLYFLQTVDIYTQEGEFIASKPIQDVLPGEFVRSRDEKTGQDIFVDVIANHDHGELELFDVTLDTGETTRCTMNHKFRVEENDDMLPLWEVIENNLSIVVGKDGMSNVVSLKHAGKAQARDLEVNHPDHQYYLSNGMLTSNSHATLYSMISFHTAYLKANYPIEFMVANLMSEVSSNAKASKDNILKIKSEIRANNVKIVPPDVNTSSLSWKIIDDKTLMTGLDSLKYMGKDAIPELIAKRPFTNFQDLIYRTDASKVRSPSIQAMAASGSLDSFGVLDQLSLDFNKSDSVGINRKLMFHYASDYRAKLRSHMAKLDKSWAKAGNNLPIPPERVQSHLAEFKYPFPEVEPWSIQEMYALEDFYMGEGISGDTFDRYPKFFDKKKTIPFAVLPQMFSWKLQFEDDERANRKANTHYLGNQKIRPLEGVITNMFVFTVKKEDSKIFGQEMARLTIQDPWGDESTLLCFPEAWEAMKIRIEKELSGFSNNLGNPQRIEAGIAIRFLAQFQWENEHTTSFILSDILDFKPSPSLPKDRASHKVKMPRSKKLTKEELEQLTREEMLERLEDKMLEEGIPTVDDFEEDSV